MAAVLLAVLVLLVLSAAARAGEKASPHSYHQMMAMVFACQPAGEIKERDDWIRYLWNGYGEAEVAAIYLTPEAIAELFVNSVSGTWTVLRSSPTKEACIAAAGRFPFRSEPMV